MYIHSQLKEPGFKWNAGFHRQEGNYDYSGYKKEKK